MKTVVVGMSGGVDSAVAALLLKEQGYRVIGVFMNNWNPEDEECSAFQDYEDVKAVCEQLDISYYSVEFIKEYEERVFKYFLDEYKAGYTPNPDILCNREIKFDLFYKYAKDLGADYLATGHYARVGQSNGQYTLLKGLDQGKDQSYFLYTLKGEILKDVLFPLGGLQKSEVRALAKKHQLKVAAKKDSTGICFIGERKFRAFLQNYLKSMPPGDFETPEGEVVGKHQGIAYYTIGQRKGLGLGGPGEPWFVSGKDISRNVIQVVRGINHPALFSSELIATDLTWVNPFDFSKLPMKCKAKVRYRQIERPCLMDKIDTETLRVTFDKPERAITPRQSVVFYQGDSCLGGGVIAP